MPPERPDNVIAFPTRAAEERCAHCGSPLVSVPAYPRAGRRLACLAGWSAPRQLGALPCGAPRWADRAA